MVEGNRILDDAATKAAANVSPLEGSGLAQDAADLAGQAVRGDWTEGLISASAVALDAAELLKDPVAKLVSMGLGWVIEFFGPLNWILDQLVGDQEQIDRLSLTWEGISTELGGVAEDLHVEYRSATADWSGPGVAQYMRYCGESVELYKAASDAAAATAGLIKTSGLILKVVRTIVRQLITDCVGKVISIVLRYPPPATPAAAPEVASAIADTGTTATKWLNQLKRAFSNAGEMLKQSMNLFRRIGRTLANCASSGKSAFDLALGARGGLESLAVGAKHARAGAALLADLPAEVAPAVLRETREGLGDVVNALPEKVLTESAKEYGKQVAAGPSTDFEGGPGVKQAVALYDGPGPHRVSGTLEEPS